MKRESEREKREKKCRWKIKREEKYRVKKERERIKKLIH